MDAIGWGRLLRATAEINDFFEDDIAFIGGVAVYAHAMMSRDYEGLAVFSHDADFVIMLNAFADLRDLEVVTPSKNFRKQQFTKDYFEFDVYVQNQTDLRISVEEIVAASEEQYGLRVASLEHLLLLKIPALKDRKGSQKGEEDAQDIVRIMYLIDKPDPLKLKRITEDDMLILSEANSLDHILPITNGNRHLAKNLKSVVENNFSKISYISKEVNSSDCEP
ncbi:hypothetical protein [Pseudosulfitobacter pseudonitzschiae]|uniref:hypothetical protein n=1 Tax=Pseudosulfitobacter pseudonitzschiae TaxID=1402135 RepID=UPI003B7E779D